MLARVLGLAAVLSVAGCSLGPAPPLQMPAGSRVWIIKVENFSGAPARLFVASDGSRMGRSVGSAAPSIVPPGVSQDVVFTVPPGDGWAIFVNPIPEHGPLILASDVPAGLSGRLPLVISVDRGGSSGVQAPGDPGWFGN